MALVFGEVERWRGGEVESLTGRCGVEERVAKPTNKPTK